MTLLEKYVNTVRMYLRKGPQQEDILQELSEHLQSKLDEEEARVGRPLTEIEQEAVLTRHGNPAIVADRYGAPRRSVAFGWQLIGPELFPLFLRILLLNWIVTIVAIPLIAWFGTSFRHIGFWTFAGPMLVQLVIVTVVFTCVEVFQRTSLQRHVSSKRRPNWRFPPVYLQVIPKWQSLVALIAFAVLALWWALLPFIPALMLGRAAASLEFSSSTTMIYVAVLVVLLVSAAQRATTFVHPEWNWLQAVTRLLTNSSMLVLLYPIALSFPYVVVSPSAADAAGAEHLANAINSALWWIPMGTLSIYWLITALFHAWVCAQFVRYTSRRRTEQFS